MLEFRNFPSAPFLARESAGVFAHHWFDGITDGFRYGFGDISRLYQTTAGLTAIGVSGDPIGLIMDRRGDGRGTVNLLLRSDNLTMAPWAVANTTVSADGSPDDALMVNSGVGITVGAVGYFTSGSGAYRSQPVAALPAGTYTYSMRVKKNGYDAIQLRVGTSTPMNTTVTDGFGIFNLTSGTVVAGTTAASVNLGDGYFLISITFTLAATTTVHIGFWIWNSVSVTADGTKGYLISYMQLERGASATAHQRNVSLVGGPGKHANQASAGGRGSWQTGNILRVANDDAYATGLLPGRLMMARARLTGGAGTRAVAGASGSATGRFNLYFNGSGAAACRVGDGAEITAGGDRTGIDGTLGLRRRLDDTIDLVVDGMVAASAAMAGSPTAVRDISIGAINNNGSLGSYFHGDFITGAHGDAIIAGDIAPSDRMLRALHLHLMAA